MTRVGPWPGFKRLEATVAIARQITPDGVRVDPGAGRESLQSKTMTIGVFRPGKIALW